MARNVCLCTFGTVQAASTQGGVDLALRIAFDLYYYPVAVHYHLVRPLAISDMHPSQQRRPDIGAIGYPVPACGENKAFMTRSRSRLGRDKIVMIVIDRMLFSEYSSTVVLEACSTLQS